MDHGEIEFHSNDPKWSLRPGPRPAGSRIHPKSMEIIGILISQCWDIGISQYWDMGISQYWDMGICQYWDMGISQYRDVPMLGYLKSGISQYGDIRIWRYWDIPTLCGGTAVPPRRFPSHPTNSLPHSYHRQVGYFIKVIPRLPKMI